MLLRDKRRYLLARGKMTMSSDTYQNFIIGKGDEVKDGKSSYKDFVQVYFEDHDKALDIAMQILNTVHNQRHLSEQQKTAISVSLTGSLESEEE